MYIYGKNVLKEKLKKKESINEIYLSDKFNDKEILDMIDDNMKIIIKKNYELDKMVKGLHQGIVANVDDYKTYELKEVVSDIKKKYPLFVILDHIEDPHNFGAIIRTSEALGVDGIIIPNDRSVSINSTVIKTSAGAIENMKIISVSNLVNAIKYLKDMGYWIVGTDMSGTSYNDIDYKMPIALIIGNEGSGMSSLVKKSCDFIASIDMIGKINSLNASVACAIMIANINNSRGI